MSKLVKKGIGTLGRRARPVKHWIAVALVCQISLNGCASSKTLTVAPDETSRTDLIVTLEDSRMLSVRNAYAREDTLYGSVDKEPAAIPLKEITRMSTSGGSSDGAIAGIVLGTFLLVGVGFAVFAATFSVY